MPKPLSLDSKLERFPPVACRILARAPTAGGRVRALSDAEVAAGSGLSVRDIARLSRLTSWDAVEIAQMRAFLKGCGADLDDRDWLRHNAAYMKKLKSIPLYLRQHADWEKTFKPLLALWVSAEAA